MFNISTHLLLTLLKIKFYDRMNMFNIKLVIHVYQPREA